MTTRPRVPSILIIILFAYAIGTSSLVTVGRRLASFALHYSKDAKVENISKVQKGSIIEHLTAKGGMIHTINTPLHGTAITTTT